MPELEILRRMAAVPPVEGRDYEHMPDDLDDLSPYPEPELDRLIDRILTTARGESPWISQTHWR